MAGQFIFPPKCFIPQFISDTQIVFEPDLRRAAAKSLPCNVKRPLKQFDYDVYLTDRFITAVEAGNGYEPGRADSREDGGSTGGERGRLGETDGRLLSLPK